MGGEGEAHRVDEASPQRATPKVLNSLPLLILNLYSVDEYKKMQTMSKQSMNP